MVMLTFLRFIGALLVDLLFRSLRQLEVGNLPAHAEPARFGQVVQPETVLHWHRQDFAPIGAGNRAARVMADVGCCCSR